MEKPNFRKWAKKTGATHLVCQEKLDGISMELGYVDGKLKAAITRGDGFIGESVLHTVSCMENVKKEIKGFSGSLRGEVILKKTKFEKKLHFAWDQIEDESKIVRGLELVKKHKVQNVHIYVLIGYGTTEEQDLHRCQKIIDFGYDPYKGNHI